MVRLYLATVVGAGVPVIARARLGTTIVDGLVRASAFRAGTRKADSLFRAISITLAAPCNRLRYTEVVLSTGNGLAFIGRNAVRVYQTATVHVGCRTNQLVTTVIGAWISIVTGTLLITASLTIIRRVLAVIGLHVAAVIRTTVSVIARRGASIFQFITTANHGCGLA